MTGLPGRSRIMGQSGLPGRSDDPSCGTSALDVTMRRSMRGRSGFADDNLTSSVRFQTLFLSRDRLLGRIVRLLSRGNRAFFRSIQISTGRPEVWSHARRYGRLFSSFRSYSRIGMFKSKYCRRLRPTVSAKPRVRPAPASWASTASVRSHRGASARFFHRNTPGHSPAHREFFHARKKTASRWSRPRQ